MANKRSISRLISLMLRHRPDEFGLDIDKYGFVPLEQVVEAVRERYDDVSEEDVVELVKSPDQHRFELTERGIRALYGHSFYVEMDGEPMVPPQRLYMGTTAADVRRFATEGIHPGDRFYVHLSKDLRTAAGRSREKAGPVVVEVLAGEAHVAGVQFYERGEVVLTRQVPAAFVGPVHGVEGQARVPTEEPARSPGVSAPRPEGPITYGRRPRKATRR